MPDVQKTPLVTTLNPFVERTVQSNNQLLGKGVPASVVSVDSTNTIVTVQFEMQSIYTLPKVTCPVFGPQFMRYPLRPGVQGVVLSADFYLGGVSGLGGGIATLDKVANLSACVFFPTGNANFSATDNPDAVVIYGPDGVVIKNDKSPKRTATVLVDGEGNVVIYGARSVSTDVHGYGERLTYDGGAQFTHETWHDGATVIEIEHGFHPPEIPPP